jgi:hypothetical protein
LVEVVGVVQGAWQGEEKVVEQRLPTPREMAKVLH